MGGMRWWVMIPLMGLGGSTCLATAALAEQIHGTPSSLASAEVKQIIVQIYGRLCEYRRSDVERALRQFDAVQAVEFLNNHGTVLVTYRPDRVVPEQLAEEVERALAWGWGCKVRAG